MPNSQEDDLSFGEQVDSQLVVLDTPDRNGYVEPKLSPHSKKLHESWFRRPRRNILPQCSYDFSSMEEDTNSEYLDSYNDTEMLRRFHPAIDEKYSQNSHS